VRTFTVAPVAPFITAAQAASNASVTTLSATPSVKGDGSISGFTTCAAAGNNPYAIATGKLTASGRLDLVTANNGSNTVSVFLGNGDGTVKPAVTYPVGPGPLSVAIADLNGDGKPDLVVANNSGNTLSVLLGNGDGTFKPAVSLTVGRNPYAVSVADLGNGKIDLVTVNSGDNTVSVLVGNGDGTFKAPANFATGRNPTAVRVADMNGDGKPDLVVANNGDNTVSILLGNGDGTFKATVNYPTGSSPLDLVVADFNGDGKPDVATVSSNTNVASVLLNKGDGTLLAAVNYGTGPGNGYRLAAADLRGAGKVDLIIANYNSNRLAVLLGKGDGTFDNPVSYYGNGNPIAVAVGDFNGDGRLDVATANYGNSSVTVWTGNALQPLAVDPISSGLTAGFGRGNISADNYRNYWTWSGKAGDLVSIATENEAGGGSLAYYLYTPTGDQITSFCSDGNGRASVGPVTLPASGRYTLQVAPCSGYQGEYDVRVSDVTASTGLQTEAEPNTDINRATVLRFSTSGTTKTASVAGAITTGGDLDYFNLGTIQPGMTIFLSVRKPSSSPLDPVVSLYDSNNGYVVKTSGRPFDSVAQIDVRKADTYYAVVRGGNGTGGLLDQYILDVQIVPTGTINFANLQVSGIMLPHPPTQSGQQVTFSYTVTNIGNQATDVASWSDRAVLSVDKIYGNADDIAHGVWRHTGVLNPNGSYTVTQTVTIPDGITGDYYIIVEADTYHEVNLFVLRGSNITVSDNTFHVTLAPYPALTVDNLKATNPGPDGMFSVTWSTANHGTGQTNNTSSITVAALLAPYPDLQVANVRAEQPANLASGAHVTVGWDDNNIGNTAVPGTHYDNVLVQKLNGDGTFTTIASGNVQGANNLAAGGSAHFRFAFDLPNGTKAPVTQATNGQFDHVPTPSSLQVQVTATMQAGWSYLQMPDPANGRYHLVRIVRSDGFMLPVGDDAWVTDRTFGLDPTARPTYENILHLIDFNGTGRYTFYYAPNDTTPPMIQQLAPITSPRITAVDEEDVTFSKAINPATFANAALVLTRDGGTNLITAAVTIMRISDTVYAIKGLAGLTATDGVYHLIVSAAGVQDTLGNLGTGSLDITWTMAAQAPAVVSITGTPALRNTPVASLVVTFNKPIDLTTFDYHVLSLTLNNGPNLITSAVTVTQTGTSTYQIDGLNRVTGAAGQYVFSIRVTAVKDQMGHLGAGSSTLSWTVDTTAPTLAANGIAAVASPRNTTVSTLDVTFSKPINLATFTYRALTLTRNGGANLITNAVTITFVSGSTYRINDLDALQATDGTYVLTVDASTLQDVAGNAGKGTAMQTWVLKTTRPAMPTNLVVVPTGGGIVRNGVSSTLSVTLSGSVGEAGLLVHLYDATFYANLPDATVTGTSFSKALVFATAGAHRIQVQAADAAGNLSAPAFFDLFIDTTPPAVSQVLGPGATKNPVATVDVVFSKPIDATTFDYHQLTLTRNGGANLITSTSGVQVALVSGATFRISGLTNLTRAEGVYVLTVSAVGVKDPVGNQGAGSASARWVNDQTPPQSMVLPLPAQSPPNFLVQWTGTDLPASGASGIAFFDIYVSVDGGAFSVWQAQTTATSATYSGQQGHRYGFYSVATDNAGNVERTPTMAQTTTLVSSGVTMFQVVSSANPVVAGTAFMVTVSARDGSGNLVPGFTGQVHFSSTDPAAVLPADYTFTTADAGVHTFTVTLKTTGSRTVGVAAGVLTGNTALTVNPAVTSKLVVAGFPSPVTAGVAGMLTVTAQDAYGNTTPAYTGKVHFSSSDAQAALPDDYTFVAGNHGVHTFNGIVLKTAATQTVTAADTATGSITGTQGGIVVNPAAADHFQLTAPVSERAGRAFALSVTALDPYGNLDVNYQGTITFSSSDPVAQLPADYAFTAQDRGMVTFARGATLFLAGSQTITAADVATGQVTDSGTVVVTAAAADHFQLAAPDQRRAGRAFALTLTTLDPYGNVAVNYQGTVTFSSSDPMAQLPAPYTFTPQGRGTVTFTGAATLFLAGSQTITAIGTPAQGTSDRFAGSVLGSATVLVTPAAADHFQLSAPSHHRAGLAFTLTLSALDPYGNVDVNYAGTVTFSSSDPQALLPADYTFSDSDQGTVTFTGGATLFLAGSQTITVTDVDTGLLTGSATVLVGPATTNDQFRARTPGRVVSAAPGGVPTTAPAPSGAVVSPSAGSLLDAATAAAPSYTVPGWGAASNPHDEDGRDRFFMALVADEAPAVRNGDDWLEEALSW
jgi:hypothetical protein